TIGRAEDNEVCVDDPSISRNHAALEIGQSITVQDLGSANGTRLQGRTLAPRTPTPVANGQVIDVGATLLIIQRGQVHTTLARLWSHSYFEARLEEECIRSSHGPRSAFALLRVHVEGEGSAELLQQALTGPLRSGDVIGAYGPGEYEILLL